MFTGNKKSGLHYEEEMTNPSIIAVVSKTPWPLWTIWSSIGITIAAGSVVIPPKMLEYMARYCCLPFSFSLNDFSFSMA